MGPHNLRVRTSIWLQSSFLSDLSSTKSAKIIKNEKMANNWKLRLNFLQTKSVSLEDCNSKYLQSQERFKVVSLVQSKARYRFFGLVVISRPRKYKIQGSKVGLEDWQSTNVVGVYPRHRLVAGSWQLQSWIDQLSNIYNNIYFFETWMSKSKY